MAQSLQALRDSFVAQVIPAQAITASGDATGVDTSNFESPLNFVVNIGAVTGTNPTLAVVVQQSDTVGGTYATVSGDATLSLTSASANTTVLLRSYNVTKQFVRLDYTIGGTSTPTFNLAADLIAQPHQSSTSAGYTLAPAN